MSLLAFPSGFCSFPGLLSLLRPFPVPRYGMRNDQRDYSEPTGL